MSVGASNKGPLSVSDALARILDNVAALETERVPIAAAHGRTLAAPLAARHTQPPFDASAMDGYAVRGADIASYPARLKVIGESAAGRGFHGEVRPGQAVRIFTGAPVPAGADTIVIQENTTRDGETRTGLPSSSSTIGTRPMAATFGWACRGLAGNSEGWVGIDCTRSNNSRGPRTSTVAGSRMIGPACELSRTQSKRTGSFRSTRRCNV